MKTNLLCLMMFTFSTLSVIAQSDISYNTQNVKSYSYSNNVLLLNCENGVIEIQAFTEDIIKIAMHDDFITNNDTSYSVILKPFQLKINFLNKGDYLEYATDSVTIKINKSPLKLSYFRDGKLFLKDTINNFFRFAPYNYSGVSFKIDSNESIYGQGERALPINKRNGGVTMFNANRWGYEWGYPNCLNLNVPFIISSGNYGVLFDNSGYSILTIDVRFKDVIEFTAISNKFSTYIIAGSSFSDIFNKYTDLTGKQPLPPRWALGYIQSRAYYYDDKELNGIMDRMIDEEFPIDGVVMDMSWFGSVNEMSSFEWNKNNFPDPIGLINNLKDKGINTVLISEPYVAANLNNFKEAIDKKLYAGDSSGKPLLVDLQNTPGFLLLDLTKREAVDWFWSKYKTRSEENIGGWWCDGGEPDCENTTALYSNGKTPIQIHNIYSNLWLEMLYVGYKKDFPDQRPFFMTRAGWAGIQRFGAYPLCGDVARTFGGLKAMIPVMLSASMSGTCYLHSDAGGYGPFDNVFHQELYARWILLGAFSPIMRVHLAGPIPAEPIFYDDSIKSIVRDISNLRYELLPYNYTLSYINSTAGTPLMKPINYYEPSNKVISDINDEFLWGDNFLVAPIVDSVFKREIFFPSGRWIDYFDGKIFEGGTKHEFDVPLNKLPLFVKSGSIIPMAPRMKNNVQYKYDTLIVKYYPDTLSPKSKFTLYIDDGLSAHSLEKEQFDLVSFNSIVNAASINLKVKKTGKSFINAPKAMNLTFKIYKIPFKPGMILLNNSKMKIVKSFKEYFQNEQSAFYVDDSKELWFHYNWNFDSTDILITDSIDDIENKQKIDSDLYLKRIYPNPFNDFLAIEYCVENPVMLDFKFYSITGDLIYQKHIDHSIAGQFEFLWNCRDEAGNKIASGFYVCKISNRASGIYQTNFIIKK